MEKVKSNMTPHFFRRWRHKKVIDIYCHTSFNSATHRMAKVGHSECSSVKADNDHMGLKRFRLIALL